MCVNVKSLANTSVLPKGKTAKGLNFCVNQEKYLKVFLEDGDVPIDNSASERAIRTFCLGKRIGCFITPLMVPMQVLWFIVSPKLPN